MSCAALRSYGRWMTLCGVYLYEYRGSGTDHLACYSSKTRKGRKHLLLGGNPVCIRQKNSYISTALSSPLQTPTAS
jgi:hypothetical protein